MTKNYLSSVGGAWSGDGSEGTMSSVALPELSLASEGTGSPFNVMLNSELTSNNYFFEIEIKKLNGSLSVGVVKQDEFAPGWKTKGMFYNGNVTNGSAALIVGFGDYLKEGSKVGVRLLTDDTAVLKVAFYIDGRCLGTAFTLEGMGSKDIFKPCLHVTGEAVVEFITPDEIPEGNERQEQAYSDPYSGTWKVQQLLTGPELGEYPLSSDIVLTFVKTNNGYDFSVKVANSMSTGIQMEGKADGFDKIKVGMARTTMMMPPPELQEVEQLIASSLSTLNKMKADEKLIMTGPTTELISCRYTKHYDPLGKYN